MPVKKSTFLTFSVFTTLALSACHSLPAEKFEQFWQRESMGEAAYAQGPKAQQMLNRDIARCVSELQEMERLGAVRNAIPSNTFGRVLNPDEKRLAEVDSPARNQNLLDEHLDYVDFEGCMAAKGWGRVDHVPYDVADKGRINYDRIHVDRNKQPIDGSKKSSAPSTEQGDFSNLNN